MNELTDDTQLEIIWILNNILACGEEAITKILNSNIIKYLFKMTKRSRTSKVINFYLFIEFI